MPHPFRKRWIKLWTQEVLYGTTSKELTLEQQAIWYKLLALAGDSPAPGIVCLAPDVPYPVPSLAKVVGSPTELFAETLERLASEEVSKITINTGLIYITNWEKYQTPFSKKDYMRDYMRDYRGEKIEEQGKQAAEAKGPPTTIPTVKLPGQEEPDPISLIVSSLAQNYEKEIGLISAVISSEFVEFARYYHQRDAPLPWIDEAFTEAVKNNVRKWSYVKAILKTWMETGKATKAKGEDQVEKQWQEKQKRALEQESSAE